MTEFNDESKIMPHFNHPTTLHQNHAIFIKLGLIYYFYVVLRFLTLTYSSPNV